MPAERTGACRLGLLASPPIRPAGRGRLALRSEAAGRPATRLASGVREARRREGARRDRWARDALRRTRQVAGDQVVGADRALAEDRSRRASLQIEDPPAVILLRRPCGEDERLAVR